MSKVKGESRELFEWVKAGKELSPENEVYPLRVTRDDGSKFYTIGHYEGANSFTYHSADGVIFLEDEIEWLKPIPQSSLKEETDYEWANFKDDFLVRCDRYLRDRGASNTDTHECISLALEDFKSSLTPKSIRDSEAAYNANFLWGFSDDSIESIGYEFANAKTEGYQKECWNDLIEKIKSASLKPNKLSDSKVVWKDAELSPNVKVTISSLPSPTSIEEYKTVIANLIEAIPSQTNDRDWWPDSLTDAVDEANKLLENKKPE